MKQMGKIIAELFIILSIICFDSSGKGFKS
jgi:hypothetical protein